jgi:phospholipid/cholesterol/gamma-HCH transport system substrate-binding protein
MQNSAVETLIGAVVIAVAVAFFAFAYTSTGAGPLSGGYEVVAKFSRADGVNVGTDVRMSGIKVGTVSRMALDPQSYSAVLTLAVDGSVKLPDDSSIRITSDGLLGNQYLSIEPGGSQTPVVPGGEIENTQGSIDLLGLLSKAMFGGGESK